MAGVNKVIIIGRLGKDVEIRFTPNGGVAANLAVATSDEWKDKQTGESKQKVEWHRVVMFGKIAEIAGEYLKKGSKVYLEGSLQTRKWQNQQGQDQYTTEIVLQGFNGVMQMLDGKPQGQQAEPQQSPNNGYQQQSAQQQQAGYSPQGQKPAPQQQGYVPQQSPNGGFAQPINQNQQQGGYQQQARKVAQQEPGIDFDDDIPF